MRVVADEFRCVGAGHCVRTAPEVFDQDPAEGVVVLRVVEVPDEARALVAEAVDLCPSRAIAVVD